MVDMDAPQAADRGTSDPARVDPALLDRLAARQAGHLTVWQLVMLGVARSSVTELVSRRGWTRVHRGVLRVLGGRVDDMGQLWAGLLCVAGVGGPGRATSRLLEGGDRVAALAAAVSDVAVTSRTIRQTVTAHGLVAFVFNVTMIALTVSIAGDAISIK